MRYFLFREDETDYSKPKLGAKDIAFSVIERALLDIHGDCYYARDALEWFFRDDTVPLSFHFYLEQLDMLWLKPVIREKIISGSAFTKNRQQG